VLPLFLFYLCFLDLLLPFFVSLLRVFDFLWLQSWRGSGGEGGERADAGEGEEACGEGIGGSSRLRRRTR